MLLSNYLEVIHVMLAHKSSNFKQLPVAALIPHE
jgi:hypothetical protein